MPSANYHAIDLPGIDVPQGAERRRLKLKSGVILERAQIGGDWKLTGIAFPKESFTVKQAQKWAETHGHEGKVRPATDAPRSDSDLADAVEAETVHHHDSVGILGSPKVRPDGTLLVMGRLAKPGILHYRDGLGGVRRELVTDETLRDPAWLRTVARAPATYEHPVRDGELVDVDPDNVSEFGVGDVDGRVDVDEDDYVVIRMAVRRRDAVTAVRTGDAVELSPGYDCDTDPTPGVHPVFGEYDAIQVRRRCNHVAITERGRGGHDVGIRRDSALLVQERDITPQEDEMDKEKLVALLTAFGMDPKDAKRCDSLDDALDMAKDRKRGDASAREMYDELMTDFRKMKRERDKAQGKVDAMQTELEQLKADKKGDSDDNPAADIESRIAWADDRAELFDVAKAHEVTLDDNGKRMDNEAIRLAIVQKAVGDRFRADSDDVDGYVRGVYDHLVAKRGDSKDDDPPSEPVDPWASLSRGDGRFPPRDAEDKRRDAQSPFDVQRANCAAGK